jgi:1,2-diacylglycerol 3-alpha-glucosyltransferase
MSLTVTDPGTLEGTTYRAREDWPRRLGILNDYLRIPYANGSSFASQFLYREFGARGHDVTVLGPSDPLAAPHELPESHIGLPSMPLRMHPGVRLPLPTPRVLKQIAEQKFDVLLAQVCSAFLDLGAWLRAAHGVPFLCVNTVHLPSVYNVLLPDRLHKSPLVNAFFGDYCMPWLERQVADNYNQSDGLIVLSEAFESYWRKRGVTVPIHVIPRAVEPRIFDAPPGVDPFPASAKRGSRLLCVCRHTREKELGRLLEIFARWIAPRIPEATLTLVGDGPDHMAFRNQAVELGIADRTFFPGEYPVTTLPNWYRHADLFVYTSLSETYGQVVSEAMWCGLPVVALYDDMGVSQQVRDGENGVLVMPASDQEFTNWRFGSEAVALLRNHQRRAALAATAERSTRARAAPERCIERYYRAFQDARGHCLESRGNRRAPAKFIARWTAINMTVAGLACVRPPAEVNRHGRKQPHWEALGPERATSRPSEIVASASESEAG